MRFVLRISVVSAVLCVVMSAAVSYALPDIPNPTRDYRAAWCATVTNIDWPPQAGVSSSIVDAQKARLIAHLDKMQQAHMNAMYFQVRPACDAMYISPIEPPSQWLTGSQTTAAVYDPLAFAVAEAHKRGIELHAWVNPYRAALDQKTSNKAYNHVMVAHPDYCVTYSDGKTYLNPGKNEVIAYIMGVISDVVTRYDVDGVVFDDYFYPGDIDDAAEYTAYTNAGGSMSKGDWRRDNVNRLIWGCYATVHGIRQSCQFEVGPFGIWRPGYPAGVVGADYYATHYCDTRKWLQMGWVDSLSPQLYWTLDSTGQPFGALIDWWVQQNPARHVLASTADYRVGSTSSGWSTKTASEIVNQVLRTYQAGGVGDVHYSVKWLTDDPKGVRAALMAGPYANDCLRPASTWLDNVPPVAPNVDIGAISGSKRTISFSQPAGGEAATWWCFYIYNGAAWTLKVLPGITTSYDIDASILDIAVSAVDRCGNESARRQLSLRLATQRRADVYFNTSAWRYAGDSWLGNGTAGVLADYDSANYALRLRVASATSQDAPRTRMGGWYAGTTANTITYGDVGPNQYLRAKFYVYAAGQQDPNQKNQIPAFSMRVGSRFAVTSNLEVTPHLNALSQGDKYSLELAPSTNPGRPSVYRVDYDPVDVSYLASNPTDPIYMSFAVNCFDWQDNGNVCLKETALYTYPTALLPDDTISLKKTYYAAAGDMDTRDGAASAYCLQFDPLPGEGAPPIARYTTGPYLPTVTTSTLGTHYNSASVPTSQVGIIEHYFTPNRFGVFPWSSSPRVQENKQYKIRFHVTSTQHTSRQSPLWLYTRSIGYSWVQKIEFGGSWAVDNANDPSTLIIRQAQPGVETEIADGWYNVLMTSPMSTDIRSDWPDGTPLSTSMPNIYNQPGPGVNSFSWRELCCGVMLIDTLNSNPSAEKYEVGDFTIDRVQVREYEAIAD